MKKILSIIGIAGILCSTTTSCDEYIDITPRGSITVDSAYQYYELIVNPMRSYMPTAFHYLSDNAWAKESSIIGYENLSWDGINFTFNEKADRTILADNNLYENMYGNILRSNLVIDNIDEAEGSADIKQLAKAEARTFRAFDHFLAINTYAKAYDPATAAQDGGVCIVEHYDLEATPPKSTVEQVYTFIIKELEESVELLQEKPANIYHPNKAFGYALLAKVYLFHRDWEKAREYARKSLSLNNALVDYNDINAVRGNILRYGDLYGDDKNPEVLSYLWIGSGWNLETTILYNYGMISPELIALYGPNDLRYTMFFFMTRQPATYFDAGSGADLWIQTLTNQKFMYTTVGMRTAEVYLLLAEAEARLNNLKEATDNVNAVREHRISGNDRDISQPATQQEMIKLIIDERRRELLFGFNRFFDLKRFNLEPEYAKTITRVFPVVNKSVEQKTYTLAPNSRLYIIPFPHSARDKNPNLTLNTDE